MKKERRETVRHDRSIPVFFSDTEENGSVLESKTINLAPNGMYCKVNKFIEPYTKLFCTLMHPMEEDSESIIVEGVVVRCEPPEFSADAKDYNIAVFFSDIAGDDRKRLERWLSLPCKSR